MEKEKFFEDATKKLLKMIDSMGLEKLQRMRAKNFTLLFRDSFKLPDVRHQTFWADLGDEGMAKLTYDSDGFCRAASLNFAKLMGNTKEWQLMYIDRIWLYGPHHYLLHVPSKTILDLTYDQYDHAKMCIPYYLGKPIDMETYENDVADRFFDALNLQALMPNNQKD